MHKIGITIGDINGVGPEVILKALSNNIIFKNITPIIYGSYKVLSYHKNIIGELNLPFHTIQSPKQASPNKINIINCWEDNVNITIGKPTQEGGKYAILALERAMNDASEGSIDAIVTAPINKEAMQMAGFQYPGHTEFFTTKDKNKDSLMMLRSDDLTVALVTNHVAVKEVASTLSKELLQRKIMILNETLIQDFGHEKPLIAILGLNPHASDNSVIGDEEEKILRPAIIELKKQGLNITGPHPADGFFGSQSWKKYDAVLAMYHDQGLIPFKALTFGSGTNVTCGLSIIRTSPDHGTAYDIVGNNIAASSSMLYSIFTAVDIVKNRKNYYESKENALVRREKKTADINE